MGLRDADASHTLRGTSMHTYLFTGTLITLEPLAFSPPSPRGANHHSRAAAHARAERRRPGGHRLPLGQHHPRRVPPRLRRGVARARGDSDAPALPRAHRRGREGQRRGAARRLERARGLSRGRPLPRPVRGGALADWLDSRTPRRRRGAPRRADAARRAERRARRRHRRADAARCARCARARRGARRARGQSPAKPRSRRGQRA